MVRCGLERENLPVEEVRAVEERLCQAGVEDMRWRAFIVPSVKQSELQSAAILPKVRG